MPKLGSYGVVSHSQGTISAGIRLITRSRYSHAFVVISDTEVIESAARGAILSPLAKYTGRPAGQIAYNDDEPIPDGMRSDIADHARWFAGTPYGYVDIAAVLLASLGLRWKWLARIVDNQHRMICSQLADFAYQEAGVQLFDDGRLPQNVVPGDLVDRLAERPWETQSKERH